MAYDIREYRIGDHQTSIYLWNPSFLSKSGQIVGTHSRRTRICQVPLAPKLDREWKVAYDIREYRIGVYPYSPALTSSLRVSQTPAKYSQGLASLSKPSEPLW